MLDEGILIRSSVAGATESKIRNSGGAVICGSKITRTIRYTFQAYLRKSFWYNSDWSSPTEIRSLDDFLNPKWISKSLSRSAHAGSRRLHLGFIGGSKGRLSQKTRGAEKKKEKKGNGKMEKKKKREIKKNGLIFGRDQRQLAESLAKGRSP